MKKTYFYAGLLVVALSAMSITSCSSEETIIQEPQPMAKSNRIETPKTIEKEAFKSSLKDWAKQRAESRKSGNQVAASLTNLSDDPSIVKAARTLLLSEGYTIADLEQQAGKSSAKLISLALQVYTGQTKTTTH